jgi:alginate O-acetyltransferase complex protein AlgI
VIFHSLDFVAFFVVFTTIYWRLGRRGQNALIVLGSYLFYGYVHPWFVTLVVATTVVDYWAARGMEHWPTRRRLMLALSIAANLGLLGFFKYFNFFADNVHTALSWLGLDVGTRALSVMLPVGISFYTFQEMSYTVGVYRGSVRARRDLVDFAAFVCFFPQLVAGPIERAERLLPQIERERAWSASGARDAFFLMAWGYFKKLVVADNAGVIANKVFGLDAPGFYVLWAGVFAFAIQIYADFSAYSDIARGAARWLGFDLMMNFRHPYMATGPTDFWRRWHISLSSWFRDYVYIPLGGSRASEWKTARNIGVTFVLSGLWHGASWNYILWGGYHGVLVLISRWSGSREEGPRRFARDLPRVVVTFILVCVGWLLFRETDIQMLWRDLSLTPWASTRADRLVGGYLFLLAALYSLPIWIEGVWSTYGPSRRVITDAAAERRGWTIAGQAILAGLALAGVLVLRSQQSLDFIYFQF